MNGVCTTIYLIRHGEVNNPKGIIYGRSVDVSLSEAGVDQVKDCAQRLREKGVEPSAIYTSPMRRAVQTARELARVFDQVTIVEEEDLQETGSQGLESKTLDWVETIGGDLYSYLGDDYSIEGPEVIVQRMLRAISKFIRKHEGKTIFVVSHGDPIAFTMWRLLNPRGELPSIVALSRNTYLQKSEAWRVILDQKGRVIEHERIRRGGEGPTYIKFD